MACFIVPATEAVITSVATKVMSKGEHDKTHTESSTKTNIQTTTKGTPLRKHLKLLSNMLWGGSALLAFEHFWHGEIMLAPPFLSAAQTPENMAEMFHEMATVGVTMAVAVTAVWVGIVAVITAKEKKAQKEMEGVHES